MVTFGIIGWYLAGLTMGIMFGWFVACWFMAKVFANTMDNLIKEHMDWFDRIIEKYVLHKEHK